MDVAGVDSLAKPLSDATSDATPARRSLAHGLVLFLFYWALYGLSLLGAVGPLPLATNVLFSVLNGVFIAMLFIIGHDCCHGALVPGRSLNLWLGRIAFLPIGHSVSLWRFAHNGLHHRRNNLSGVDPVWAPMSLADYRKASAARQLLERIYRSPFGPAVYYYAGIWVSWMLVPLTPPTLKRWKQHLPDTIFVLLGFAALVATSGVLGHWLAPSRPLWLEIALGWALPFAVWNYLGALSFYLNHTHPDIPWFDNESDWKAHGGGVSGTAHVKMPIDLLPLYSAAMAHPAHHADPLTPAYDLPEHQSVLKKRRENQTTDYMLSLGEYRRIVRICKLFDHDRMCWTDFSGNPTTGRLIPATS
jgi:omega-6 fatty acid desaturase (delta-12 desaturase)